MFRRVWRRLRHRPAARVLAVLSLALGIGGASTVWAVFDALLVRPLPYPDADRLVAVWSTLPGTDAERADVASAPINVRRLAERQRVFTGVAAFRQAGFDLTGEGEPERLSGVRAMPELFEVLGAEPLLGRTLEATDIDADVVVLAEGVWRRRFGADASIVGGAIRLDGRPHVVVGVLRGDAGLPPRAELWAPLRLEAESDPVARVSDLSVVGRLRAGVGVSAGAEELGRVARELAALDPMLNANRGLRLEPLREVFAGEVRGELIALLAGVLLMLVVACSNAANLSLVRLREDARDLVVRRALGASEGRLLVVGLGEGLGMAVIAVVLGLALSAWAVPRFVMLSGIEHPGGTPAVDLRVLGFAVLAALVTAVAAGLAPALASRRADAASALREGGRGMIADARGQRARDVLVVVQVAVGLLLAFGALTASGRVRALFATNPGYEVADILTVRVASNPARHGGFDGKLAFFRAVQDAFSTIPGVERVGATNVLPVGDPDAYWSFSVEDRPPADPTIPEVARGRLVGPGYFEALGMRLVSGRDFTDTDRADAAPVVIVSRRLAERYWPGADPVGRRVKRRTWDSPYPWMTVVGVVEDVRDDGLAEPPAATIYFPLQQVDTRFSDAASFVLRVGGSIDAVAPEVRRRLAAIDGEAPVVRIATLRGLLEESLAAERFAATLMNGFALLGVVLLVSGVYGLLALVVAERGPEIALRLALGATPARVLRGVVGRGMSRVVLGVTVGGSIALAARPVLARLLTGGEPPGHGVTVAVVGVIVLVGLLAAAVPAWRAARLDPACALQNR